MLYKQSLWSLRILRVYFYMMMDVDVVEMVKISGQLRAMLIFSVNFKLFTDELVWVSWTVVSPDLLQEAEKRWRNGAAILKWILL